MKSHIFVLSLKKTYMCLYFFSKLHLNWELSVSLEVWGAALKRCSCEMLLASACARMCLFAPLIDGSADKLGWMSPKCVCMSLSHTHAHTNTHTLAFRDRGSGALHLLQGVPCLPAGGCSRQTEGCLCTPPATYCYTRTHTHTRAHTHAPPHSIPLCYKTGGGLEGPCALPNLRSCIIHAQVAILIFYKECKTFIFQNKVQLRHHLP